MHSPKKDEWHRSEGKKKKGNGRITHPFMKLPKITSLPPCTVNVQYVANILYIYKMSVKEGYIYNFFPIFFLKIQITFLELLFKIIFLKFSLVLGMGSHKFCD